MTSAFESYVSALKAAAELHRSDAVKGRIAAVKVAAQYLREMKVDLTLVTPLYDVIGHLEDGRLGRTGNSTPAFDNNNMALASLAVTFLMGTGKKVREAAATVAKETGLDAKELKRWRQNLISGLKTAEATDLYNTLIDKANASGKTSQALADHTVKRLREKLNLI